MSRPDTIVLIHGFWVTPRSWENFVGHYEAKGFTVHAPAYPGFDVEVEALNADPSPIEALTVEQILDRLEGAPRGVYSGAIGYFSLNGATDLAVAIRTPVLSGRTGGGTGLSLGVGGAITADSSPQEEYEEIRTKAFGVLSALGAEFPPG